MTIYEYPCEDIQTNNEIDHDDLLNFLSQTVLSMTDEEIRIEKQKLNDLTKSVRNIHAAFKDIKKKYDEKTSECAREKQLERVLTKIDTLNKEGSLRGSKKTSIIEILPKLNTFNFIQLTKLEERLSIF